MKIRILRFYHTNQDLQSVKRNLDVSKINLFSPPPPQEVGQDLEMYRFAQRVGEVVKETYLNKF